MHLCNSRCTHASLCLMSELPVHVWVFWCKTTAAVHHVTHVTVLTKMADSDEDNRQAETALFLLLWSIPFWSMFSARNSKACCLLSTFLESGELIYRRPGKSDHNTTTLSSAWNSFTASATILDNQSQDKNHMTHVQMHFYWLTGKPGLPRCSIWLAGQKISNRSDFWCNASRVIRLSCQMAEPNNECVRPT